LPLGIPIPYGHPVASFRSVNKKNTLKQPAITPTRHFIVLILFAQAKIILRLTDDLFEYNKGWYHQIL